MEEVKLCDGAKATVQYYGGGPVVEGEIYLSSSGAAFFLHDNLEVLHGSRPVDMRGHRYSWSLSSGGTRNGDTCRKNGGDYINLTLISGGPMGSIEEFIAKRKLTPNQKKLLAAGLMDVNGVLTTTAKKVIEDAVVEGKNAAEELQAVATEFLDEQKKCKKSK